MKTESNNNNKKVSTIGVKREGKGYNLKSSNPRPQSFKILEVAVKEVAATYERRGPLK